MANHAFKVKQGLIIGNSSTTISNILDEDDMASNSATALASQQSIKAYSDSATQTLTNKTTTNLVLNGTATGTAIKDEDDMTSNSATALATQQSIKAYVDGELAGLSQNSISQNNTNITVTDSGSNGTITFTADGNTEMTVTDSGVIVNGNHTVTGDLTVNGTTTTVNTTNTSIEDNLLALNQGVSASANTSDSGILINRGTGTDSSTINCAMIWDESENQFAFIETTEDGTNTGNINLTRYANLRVDTLVGKATQAQYADVAEKYNADADYPVGTVVELGGTNEVTKCMTDHSKKIAGVISRNPALTMNSDLDVDNVAVVALIGRVDVIVTGPVAKGDMLVSAGNGMARAEANPSVGAVIGKAIESTDSAGESVITVLVGRG